MPHPFVPIVDLRSYVARSLSSLYSAEVPAYQQLVHACRDINAEVIGTHGPDAERLGSLARVTAERHGAVRVGTPRELSQLATIFAGLGMRPTGFYDLRDSAPRPVPVVATAFRPHTPAELAANPFRVFVSVLVPQDRRFFDASLEKRLVDRLEARTIFPPRLVELGALSEREHGLPAPTADEFIELLTRSLALSTRPVDRAWYEELADVSDVAADIGGVDSTHINHLTPRVLDIDQLYVTMERAGVSMIDSIQGPPAWDGPDVLLRQTSFRALAEPRRFREPDGSVRQGSLRVRFGEVEARGLALTPKGRDRYDSAISELTAASGPSSAGRATARRAIWAKTFPLEEAGFRRDGLAYFTYAPGATDSARAVTNVRARPSVTQMVDQGLLVADPIVYEDFLPKSAAGIFASNLTGTGSVREHDEVPERDRGWLASVLNREVPDPCELYALQEATSITAACARLRIRTPPSVADLLTKGAAE